MNILLSVVSVIVVILVSISSAYTQVLSLDPNYSPSLLASNLFGPANGVIFRPATNDLLVSEFNADVVSKINITTGARSLFANTTCPDEMAINSLGHVFVKDHCVGIINRFDSNGNFLGSFSVPGFPTGIAFDTADNFYVADDITGTIWKFATGTFAPPTVFASGFPSLEGIAFNPASQLFVTDFENGRVYQVTPDGTTLASHTLWASGLSTPLNFAFDPITGDVFVSTSDTVVRISAPGVVTTFASGFTPGLGIGTYDLDFDPTGNLYVDDFSRGEVWKFSRTQLLPHITAIAPTSGPVGTLVTVTGENFVGTPESIMVIFEFSGGGGGIGADVSLISDTEIQTTVPSLLSAGTYNIVVFTSVGDSNRVAFEVTTVSGKSDLIVEKLVVNPTSGPPRSWAEITFRIRNIGNGSASPSIANIRLSASNIDVTTNDPLLGSVNVPSLASRHDIEFTKWVSIIGVEPSNYFIWVIADVNSSANQSDETNDKASSPFTVEPREKLMVNDHTLDGQQETWVRFVAQFVFPDLIRDRSDRLQVAAPASWWGLKEGTFSFANPHKHSVCSVLQKDGDSKDVRLKPLEVCAPGRAWQVGLAAVQVPNFSEQEVFGVIQTLWPGRQVTDILAEAAELAGFDLGQDTGMAIVASNGALRKSWLLRHPTVGLTLVERNVANECIDISVPLKTCYGTGWQETKQYAPTPEAISQSIADLAAIFNMLAP